MNAVVVAGEDTEEEGMIVLLAFVPIRNHKLKKEKKKRTWRQHEHGLYRRLSEPEVTCNGIKLVPGVISLVTLKLEHNLAK